jgi:nucleoid-associated protein YgaU
MSIFLLIFYFTSKQNKVLETTPTDSTGVVSPALSTKSSELGTPTESANISVETDKVTNEIPKFVNTEKNTVQINSQRIEKLEILLLQEQQKNKALYQKLNTQDVKLQELQSISINDIEIGSQDQKYIKALTENENTAILDEKKISNIDYYNKVRVLLKSNLGNKGSNKNSQLQNLVNEIFYTKETSGKAKKNINYTTSLEQESGVRSNEVRSIILKKNETLWGLAKRAYGDGMLYKKIIRANPQITESNVRFLRPGIYIRIPR